MVKNMFLKSYISLQNSAVKISSELKSKKGSVTGDMGIWVFIISAVGLLIVGLLVNYVRNEGFPALTDRLDKIMNFS